MSDHSLSDFSDDADAPDTPDKRDASDRTSDDSTDDAEELLATARFSPDGTPCEGCGAVVTRRWHDDGRFVCADCKNW